MTEPPQPGGGQPFVDRGGGSCPNCGAPYAPMQEYCLECGRRLPHAGGVIPVLAGAWRRRLPWYPGDWIWPVALLALIAALAGTASYFAAKGGGHKKTIVATAGSAPGSTAQTGTSAFPSTTGQTTSPPPPPPPPPPPVQHAPISWPASRNGYTVVLESIPISEGRSVADQLAHHAIGRGLPKVGILDSGRFSSLHPGYYVVFSGVYGTDAATRSAAAVDAGRGFPGAYSRQITH